MTQRLRQIAGMAATVLLAGSAALAQEPLDFSIELPNTESWAEITNRTVGKAFSREWVPEGQTIDNASWLIAQQQLPINDNRTAMDFLTMINDLSEEACTSSTHDEPERVRIGRARGVIGRTICAQRVDGPYGTFTDRAIVIEDGFAYIVTSEIRIPPMVVAGVLSFGRGDDSSSAARDFMQREERSREFVRERITLE